jgi:hypothetical protein
VSGVIWARQAAVLTGLALLGPNSGRAQSAPGLDAAAESARSAWLRHDAAALVQGSPGVVVRLPGVEPSGPLGRAQAAALLRTYVEGAEELATGLVAAREVETGRGYVELDRRYRVGGTQQVRRETLLLSFRLIRDRWALVELRVSG